jgi:hypothetical protein
MEDPHLRRQMNHQRGQTTRGEPPKKTPSLDKPSLTTITHSKYRLFMHVVTPLTLFVYKMCAKLKEEGLQCPSFPTPCWHIDEKIQPLVGVDI